MRQLSAKLEYRPPTTAAGKLIDENQLRRLYVKLMYGIQLAKQKDDTVYIYALSATQRMEKNYYQSAL